MYQEINQTGGAGIGMANATWPFAKLTVNKDTLTLRDSTDYIGLDYYSSKADICTDSLNQLNNAKKHKDDRVKLTASSIADRYRVIAIRSKDSRQR